MSQKDRSTDSLLRVLKTLNAEAGKPALKDTARITVLNRLSKKNSLRGDHSTAVKFARIACNISEKLIEEGFTKEGKSCLANSIHSLGYAYHSKEDFANAMIEYKKEMKVRENGVEDVKAMAQCYNSIGMIYSNQDNLPLSLEYYFKALKLVENGNDWEEQARVYNNLGIVFNTQGNFEKALFYYMKEMKLGETMKDNSTVSYCLSNIGSVYAQQGQNEKALEYFNRFLKMAEESNDQQFVGVALLNIGSTYESLNQHEKALETEYKALAIFEKFSSMQDLGLTYLNIAASNISLIKKGLGNKQKQIREAQDNIDKAFAIYTKLKQIGLIAECYHYQSELDACKGELKNSLDNYKKYIFYKDSVTNSNNTSKSVRIEMNYEFEKKESASNLEQEKKEAIAKEENEKQRAIRNLFIVAFGFMLLLAIFIFISYRQKKLVNTVISSQKLEVEEQKALVEKNQKQIIDSINYAKRIQSSILSNDLILKKALPESFIFYKPKDIVSGDFYWFHAIPNSSEIIIAVADCTGHGVPGAFLSMVGSTLLNEIVTHKNITDPAEILKALCTGLSSTLVSKQKEEMNTDGMDISICWIDTVRKKLLFAGANQTLYLVGNGGIEKTESQINSINGVFDLISNDKLFSIGVDLSGIKGVYMTTDGYADQIGEQSKKKFLSSRFEDLLLEVYNKPASEQLHEIENRFNNWKGNQKQIDDILVIGFHV